MIYQRKNLGQQLGAYIFRDPPLVIANHELAEASGTFWTTNYNNTLGSSVSNLKIGFNSNESNQTIFWGDNSTNTVASLANLNHSWANSLDQPNIYYTLGKLETTTNGRMSGNYVRGSSKKYEKLI